MIRSRRVVANLDCEQAWLQLAATSEALADLGVPPGPKAPLAPNVLARLAPLATLLRVYARDDAVLYTPAAVDPACMAAVPGLPTPRLEVGAPAEPRAEDVVWAEITEAAARVNHRAFAHALAAEAGTALPGSRLVSSLDALDAELPPRWVLKPVFSAAGHGFVLGEGPRLAAAQQRRAAALLAEQGALLLEPWVERRVDLGVCVGEETWTHLLEVDARGRFRGIVLPGPFEPGLARAERVFERIARALGPEAPFGVDAYRYVHADGSTRLQPVSDVNGRLTFGHVAAALIDWTFPDEPRGALRFGSGSIPTPQRGRVVPLVLPTATSDATAWLAFE